MNIQFFNTSCLLLLCVALSACSGKIESASSVKSGSGNPALDSLNAKINANPQNANLYADRAAIFFEKNNYDAALIDLEKAIMIDSMQPAFYSLLTDVYLQYFKSWQALRAIQKAAELFPDNMPILLKLSNTQLLLRKYDESIQTIDKILQQDPQNADAHLMLGMNLKEMGDTARAINSFQKAVNFNSDLIDGWINLGQLHESRGHAIARKYYESALQIAPNDVVVHHAKADFLSRINDLNGALAVYRDILELEPEYDEAHYNSGLLYLDMDSITQAYRQFDQAISIAPLHIRAHFYRGYSAELTGDLESAIKDYRKALMYSPDYTLALEGLKRLGAQ